MINKLKKNFLESDFSQKITVVGSLLLIIGAVLPWYVDLDINNISSKFWGITGPLYLLGVSILIGGIYSLYTDFSGLIGKHISNSNKKSHIQMGIGLQSIFLIILAFSVYSHSKFGMGYESTKSPLVGIYMSLIGGVILSVGSYFKIKSKQSLNIDSFDRRNSNQNIRESAREKINDETPINTVHEPERQNISPSPVYKVQKSQIGFETRVKTVLNPSLQSDDNNNL